VGPKSSNGPKKSISTTDGHIPVHRWLAIGKKIGSGGGWVAGSRAKVVENAWFMVFIDRRQDRQNMRNKACGKGRLRLAFPAEAAGHYFPNLYPAGL
jgi:hypothetical protein